MLQTKFIPKDRKVQFKFYYKNKMIDQQYAQLYASKQEQQRKQLLKDSFILVDIIHRTISSAEKYAKGNHQNKKYGFWDELDTANSKNENDLQFEFAMKIQTLIGGLNEFNKLYPNAPIPFYDKIPKEFIIQDLKDFKKIVNEDKTKRHNSKLYDQLIELLNGRRFNILSKQELMNGISQNKQLSQQEISEAATEIFAHNTYSNNAAKEAYNYIETNNSYYQPGELGVSPGSGYYFKNN